MNTEKIIGSNIQNKMRENNKSPTDLAQYLKVTRQTMLNYLKGVSAIDSVKLLKLSELFNVPLIDFFEAKEETSQFNLLFRTSLSESESEAAVKSCVVDYVNTYKALNELLEEYSVTFPPSYNLSTTYQGTTYNINIDIQDYTVFPATLSGELSNQIETIANNQRKVLKAENMVGLDLVQAIIESGIHIFFIDFETDSISGVSAIDERTGCYIFVNCHSTIPLERQIFTIAHEYGHILMHRPLYRRKKATIASDKKSSRTILDRMADEFAGFFLCPRSLINANQMTLQNFRRYSDLFQIKHSFQISLSALMMSLKKYGYVTPLALSRYFDFIKMEKIDKVEQSPISEIPVYMEKYRQIKNQIIHTQIRKLVFDPKTLDDDTYEIVKGSEFESVYLDFLKQKNE